MTIELSPLLKRNLREAFPQLNVRGGGGKLEVTGDSEEGTIHVLRYPTSDFVNEGGWIIGPQALGSERTKLVRQYLEEITLGQRD